MDIDNVCNSNNVCDSKSFFFSFFDTTKKHSQIPVLKTENTKKVCKCNKSKSKEIEKCLKMTEEPNYDKVPMTIIKPQNCSHQCFIRKQVINISMQIFTLIYY
jgi:hypothetical protein